MTIQYPPHPPKGSPALAKLTVHQWVGKTARPSYLPTIYRYEDRQPHPLRVFPNQTASDGTISEWTFVIFVDSTKAGKAREASTAKTIPPYTTRTRDLERIYGMCLFLLQDPVFLLTL